MKKVNLMKMFAFMALSMSFIFFTSCEEDDDSNVSIVGVWTVAGSTMEMTVNGMTFVDYMVSEGMSQADAQALYTAFQLEHNMTGTIEFIEGGIFTALWNGNEPDSGTWTLSSDNKTLTITPTLEDPMVFEVTTLTASNLTIESIEADTEDMNDDGTDETLVISSTMSFTR